MTRSPRRYVVAIALTAVLAIAAAFLYLTVVTSNPPPPASLRQTSPPRASDGPRASYVGADGPWTVVGNGVSFVGYRAQEKLALDFINVPNEAVGRTTSVSGTMTIANDQVTNLEIVANIGLLQSNEEQRDAHLVRFLDLESRPEATFALSKPIPLQSPTLGSVQQVEAHGGLTMLGTTRDIVLPVHARWNGATIEVATRVAIKQSDYGMNVPQLVIFRVADDLTIEGELVFERPGEEASPPRPSFATPTDSASPPPITQSPAPPGDLASGTGELSFSAITQRGQQSDSQVMRLRIPSGTVSPVIPPGSGNFDVQLAWSPDGRRVALIRPSGEHDPELWVGSTDPSDLKVLTTGPGLQSPDWSPDGASLVAAEDQTGTHRLVIVESDDGSRRELLDDPDAEASPDWSPDGRSIVFSRFLVGANDEDIYVVNADGSRLRQLTTDPAYEYSPDWSPDGRRIAFVRGGSIFVMDADGGAARRLTTGPADEMPAWSLDGRWIAFVRDRTIWVMNADGTAQTRFDSGFDVASDPAWNPSVRD